MGLLSCSALVVSLGSQHPPGAGLGCPSRAASQGSRPGRLHRQDLGRDGEEWGCLVRPSRELDTASSCCPLQGPEAAMALAHQPSRTNIKNNPQFWTVHKQQGWPVSPHAAWGSQDCPWLSCIIPWAGCGCWAGPGTGMGSRGPSLPCQEPQDPQGRGSGWWQDLLRAGCSPGSCHRGYCRDFTMALRAWGVSGTEGDEL